MIKFILNEHLFGRSFKCFRYFHDLIRQLRICLIPVEVSRCLIHFIITESRFFIFILNLLLTWCSFLQCKRFDSQGRCWLMQSLPPHHLLYLTEKETHMKHTTVDAATGIYPPCDSFSSAFETHEDNPSSAGLFCDTGTSVVWNISLHLPYLLEIKCRTEQ